MSITSKITLIKSSTAIAKPHAGLGKPISEPQGVLAGKSAEEETGKELCPRVEGGGARPCSRERECRGLQRKGHGGCAMKGRRVTDALRGTSALGERSVTGPSPGQLCAPWHPGRDSCSLLRPPGWARGPRVSGAGLSADTSF